MYFVYILRSVASPDITYIGFTTNLELRLKEHNAGGSPYTSMHGKWEYAFHCALPDKMKALAFEKYLKSHSGKEFASKRLI